jgi:hypothetical protein
MNLQNLSNNHSVVEDNHGNPYAIDHTKLAWFDSDDETEFEVYPINGDGFANFGNPMKMKKKELTPKFIKLIPPKQ